MTDDLELTPEERAGISSLPRDAVPPPALEERTVSALRARGLVHSGGRYALRLALAAAAAVLFFLGGFTLGHRTAARQATPSDRFVSTGAPHTGQPARLVVWF